MGAMREKDQADFDLEAFIDLFDEAITSDDPNVQKTLQHLMVIVALTRNHQHHNHTNGPLRRLFEDMRHLNQRIGTLEAGNGYRQGYGGVPTPGAWPGTPAGPIWTAPTTTTQWPPRPGTYPPGTIWSQGGAAIGGGAQGIVPPNSGAKSTTSYAWDPVNTSIVKKGNSGALGSIAERVDDLLKDEKYKGSSVGAADAKAA